MKSFILALVLVVSSLAFTPSASAHSYWQCAHASIGGGGVRHRMQDRIGGGHYIAYTQRTYSDYTYYVTWNCG